MTEKSYRAAALSARALNVSSLLTAYQAELCEDLSGNPGAATLDEMAAVTDICLRVQRCAVQATGKAMGIMVVQERARWLNLTNLPDREKEDVLDMPIVPEGIYGSALASMQRRCETKKKRTRPSTSASLEGSCCCLRSSSPSPKLLRTLLGLKHRRRRGRSPPRGQAGLENLRFRLQLRQPRISASSRGRRSERRDSPSFSPL
ncbi:hypothetical protein CgunFtcFv8_002189 [Champsocephalus gunnari]|uniref:Uncharacterized protein n=1 Tax=Champsocephalus gunnari TaxID=52237 RepID=A0AAN8H8F4_CHAGU|nr:hypothetical protein CgunFtcFv8_002189 [Champsocephalus gunnari]